MSIPVKTRLSWPLSLSEAKRHLRVDEDYHADDDYIQNLIYASTSKAEQYIGKDIAETTNVQELWGWSGNYVKLQEGNFLSFTSAITDASIALTVTETHIQYNYFYIVFAESREGDPLTVTFKTGFEEGNCPALIKQAILLEVANLYDIDRLSYAPGSVRETKAFERLLDSFRLIIF